MAKGWMLLVLSSSSPSSSSLQSASSLLHRRGTHLPSASYIPYPILRDIPVCGVVVRCGAGDGHGG